MKARYGFVFVLLVLFLTPFLSQARRHRRARHRHLEQHVTEFEQLGRVANLLRSRVDSPGSKSKTNDYACGLSVTEAGQMLRAAHADIDVNIAAEAQKRNAWKRQTENASKNYSESGWRDCAHACTCFLYEDIIAKAEPKMLTEYDIMSRDYFKRQTTELDAVQSLACARQVKNFCGSPLYRKLKTEAKNLSPETKADSEGEDANE